jgi:hypothetical protein
MIGFAGRLSPSSQCTADLGKYIDVVAVRVQLPYISETEALMPREEKNCDSDIPAKDSKVISSPSSLKDVITLAFEPFSFIVSGLAQRTDEQARVLPPRSP